MMKASLRFIPLIYLIFSIACGGSAIERDTTTDPSVSDATAAVVSEIGSTNQVILEDTMNTANELAGNLETFISNELGGPGKDGGSLLTKFAVGEQGDQSADVDITESAEACSGGEGTKQISGVLTLTIDSETADSGNMTGQYSIIYTDCLQLVRLDTSNGSCFVETQISGTITNTININFSQLDPFEDDIWELTNDVVSSGPIDFSVDNSANQQVTFDYDFYLNTRNAEDISGNVTFNTQNFTVTGIRDFISSATQAEVCP